MRKITTLFLFLTLPAFACVTGEVQTTSTGTEFVCDEISPGHEAWRDPRGLIWAESDNCDEIAARSPAKDELKNYETEMGYSVSENLCVRNSIHHYFRYPKTPALPVQEDILDFYSTKNAYGEFSNFSGFPVYVDGEWWSTSEHYFQAMKYETEELQNWVQFAPTPMEAANRGRDSRFPKRADWDESRHVFMEKALVDKYHRHEDLTKLLLSTGTSFIYEHTKNDCYWGDCGDRTGKNHLGRLLMKVRETLR